jgi:hypothetical protein
MRDFVMCLWAIHIFSVQFLTDTVLFPISVKYMATGAAVSSCGQNVFGETRSSLGFRNRNHKNKTNSLPVIPLPL